MKQFTSHIDFSLTKKRFKMMLKHYSPIRSYSIKMFLLPVLLVVTVMFCTRQPDYPIKMPAENDILYSTVDLYVNPPRSEELNIEKRGLGIRYDSEGNLFSGTQEYRYVKNDSLFNKLEFENGIMTRSVGFDQEGNTLDTYEYGYIGDEFKMIRHTSPQGVLLEQWSDVQPGEMGYHKKWHPSGQLQYEAYFSGVVKPEHSMISKVLYEGLMTLYDEEGNIIRQQRYEDGDLVETIR